LDLAELPAESKVVERCIASTRQLNVGVHHSATLAPMDSKARIRSRDSKNTDRECAVV
jgi:hypothetical protein